MPIALPKYQVAYRSMVRDVRPVSQRVAEAMEKPNAVVMIAAVLCGWSVFSFGELSMYTDAFMALGLLFFRWAYKRPFHLPFKIPKYANMPDPRNPAPGKTGGGKSEGILFIGNTNDKDNPDFGQEIWFTNNDARTHILYLGTTGAGKTEGLKALVTNALAWGSGYVYVDGKADTDLWASLYAIARRFGRDDDIFVLNYMTGNTDGGSTSNSMNPFSNGSSSYLANMVSNFMPDAGGDNAMWKERAIALLFAVMPALTYKRDHKGLLFDVGVLRDHMELPPIIRLSRDPDLPERIIHGLKGYLNTLPGYVDAAFDDSGNERPPSPDQPMYDLQVARQQHGYLSMQFTRALQMLSDEYGYIFKAQLADVDVLDVVLNRRILVTLIPALEKSGDEAANLGKIVAASLKGMMGMTLGSAVEGAWENAIGSKQTRSQSSFMAVFDEVGYYATQGMAVMAAQARSLGFSLVFASQDLPSMEKRAKQEAKSIVGNCNIKMFGRLEDPTDTKDFLEKHAGDFWAMESTGMQARPDAMSGLLMSNPFYDKLESGGMTVRKRIAYDHVREQREGEIHMFFGDWIARGNMFFVSPGKVKALRVQRLLPVPGTTSSTDQRDRNVNELTARLKNPSWAATSASPAVTTGTDLAALLKGAKATSQPLEAGIMAVASLAALPADKTAGSAKAPATGEPAAASSSGNKDAMRKPAAVDASDGASDKTAAVTMPKDAPISVPPISAVEKANLRATLPLLYEGDQFAINEIEGMPLAAPLTSSPASVATPESGGNFAGTDADLAVVTPMGSDDDGREVLDVQLSGDITAILEQSAKKLNQGLGGGGKKA